MLKGSRGTWGRKRRRNLLERLESRQVMDATGIGDLPPDPDLGVEDGEVVAYPSDPLAGGDDGDPSIYWTLGGPAGDEDTIPSEEDVPAVDDILTTTGTEEDPADRFDTNADGRIGPIDALIVVNLLNRSMASSEPGAVSAATDATGDINGDGRISPLDALLIINELNRAAATPSVDGNGIAIDEPMEVSDEGSTELFLADVDPYAVIALTFDEAGSLVAEADGQTVDVAIGTDGSLMIGDTLLPAKLVTNSEGEARLVSSITVAVDEGDSNDLIASDEEDPLTGLARIAGYTVMTLTLPDDSTPLVLDVSDGHSLVATQGDQKIEITIDEEGVLSLGKTSLPVRLIKWDQGGLLLLPNDFGDGAFVWAGYVDEAFATW